MDKINKKATIIFFLTILFSVCSHGQSKIDSLLKILKQDISDSFRVNTYNKLAGEYSLNNISESGKYCKLAYELSAETKNEQGLAASLHNFGMIAFYKGARYKALDYFIKALEILNKIECKTGLDKTSNMLGLIYKDQENFDKALEYFFLCLKIRKELKDKVGIAGCNYDIGVIFRLTEEYEKALEYFLNALQMGLETGDKKSIGLYYNHIGFIYWLKKNYDLALEYYLQSKKIREEAKDLQGLANIYTDLGNLFRVKGDFEKAETFLNSALQLALQINIIHQIESAAKGLSDLHKEIGQFEKAYSYYVIYSNLRDSINHQKLHEKVVQLNLESEFVNEEKLRELEQNKLDLENKHMLEKESNLHNMFIAGVLGFILIFIIVYRSFRAKRKDNLLIGSQKKEIAKKNEILNNQNEEIIARRNEINSEKYLATEQKDRITCQNREITKSIQYASKIQQALLVSPSEFNKMLPQSFVFYKPRDIVGGDFYFIVKKGEKTILAVADCTGHGVPGAFMSMLGLSFLNHLVNEKGIERPNVLLNNLRDMLISALKEQDLKGNLNAENEMEDWMDMAIVCINQKNKSLEFAGANSPLYYIKKGCTQIETVKPNKMPVGIHHGNSCSFTNHTVSVSSGDTFYLFSDGFADQFGGSSTKGKKFKYKMFRQLLTWLSTRELNEQLPVLEKTFQEWKNEHKQVDDILVVGFRL